MHSAALIARCLLCALVLATGPICARAQDSQAGAREAFRGAERAFEEHDYELALELFRRAQALRPHDAVRFNVAVCLERLGRFREALGEYELAWASIQLPQPAREEARRLADRIRSRLGTLSVRGEGGATVRAGALSCVVPCTLELDPGAHRVEIDSGGRTVTREVRVTRGGVHSLDVGALESEASEATESGATEGDVMDGDATDGDATAGHVAPGMGGWRSFGVMSAIGAVAFAIGAGGTIGFGLLTEELASAYYANPSGSLRDEGLTMRGLTNASIAIAAAGLLLVAIDLVVWLVDPPRDGASAARSAQITF